MKFGTCIPATKLKTLTGNQAAIIEESICNVWRL